MTHSNGPSHSALLPATLMLGLMSQGLALTAIVSALPEMARDLGSRGVFTAQMTTALAALGLMAGALVSGKMLGHFGTRNVLLTSLALFALTGAAGMISREPLALLAGRFGVGFTSACMVTVCVWGIAAEYTGHMRAKLFGLAGALSSVTGFVGTVLGGYLAHRDGWPFAFLQYPVFGIGGFALAFVSMKQSRPVRDGSLKNVATPFGQYLPFYLLVMLLFTIFIVSGTQFPFALEEDGFTDPALRSLILAVPTMAAIVTSLAYGALQRRLRARRAFTLALSCMAAGLLLISAKSSAFAACLGGSLMGACAGLVGPYLYHSVTERTTDSISRSKHIGLLNAFTFLGVFLNPLVFAPIGIALGVRFVFLFSGLIMALLATLTMFNTLWRRLEGHSVEVA